IGLGVALVGGIAEAHHPADRDWCSDRVTRQDASRGQVGNELKAHRGVAAHRLPARHLQAVERRLGDAADLLVLQPFDEARCAQTDQHAQDRERDHQLDEGEPVLWGAHSQQSPLFLETQHCFGKAAKFSLDMAQPAGTARVKRWLASLISSRSPTSVLSITLPKASTPPSARMT